MKTTLPIKNSLVAASFLAVAGPATAQMQPEGFSVGVAVSTGVSPFVGVDDDPMALPLLRYDSERVSIGFPDGLRVTVFEQDGLRFSGVLSPRLSEIGRSDAATLSGLDREITLDGGVQVDYSFGRGTGLVFRAVTELTDEHGGHEISLGARQALPLGRVPVFLGAGVDYLSGDLSEYVYGVRSGDTGFALYAPGDVFVPYLNVGAAIPITDRASVVANARVQFLPDDVVNSPIIDDDIAFGVLLGLQYRF